MKKLKPFKQAIRERFATVWDDRCQELFGYLIPIVPENSKPEIGVDAYVELWFVLPNGSRVRANGGADMPEHRTLGRLQLTIYVKADTGTEMVDEIYDEIWEPMWQQPGLYESVFFEPASPVQQVGEGEVWTQYVTDVPFRWDDN